MRALGMLGMGLALGITTASCGIIQIRSMGSPAVGGGDGYEGAECNEVLYTPEEMLNRSSFSGDSAPTPREQILLTTCGRKTVKLNSRGDRGPQRPKLYPLAIRKAHASYDDRNPDYLVNASIVTACAQLGEQGVHSDDCFGDPNMEHQVKSNDGVSRGGVSIGMAYSYAKSMDDAKLAEQLEALDLPDDVKAHFRIAYDAAKKKLEAAVGQMSEGKRRVLVDIPVEVRETRAKAFAEKKDLYAKLDELAAKAEKERKAGEVSRDTIDALLALRSEHMRACGQLECRYEPVWVEATRELALCHVANRSPVEAYVEARMLTDEGANQNGYARAIFVAQRDAALKAREAWEIVKKAKKKGLDEGTAAAAAGGVEPIRFGGYLWEAEDRFPNYAEVIDAKVERASGFVKAIKKAGDVATIEFKGSSSVVDEPFGCRDTNRLERISSDGRLEYETICQYRKKKVFHKPPPPVKVPVAEAADLKAGELLLLMVGKGSEGFIVKSTKDKTVVQLRGDRISS